MHEARMRAVQAAVLAEPQRFDANEWIGRNACGTFGCFAGWAAMLRYPSLQHNGEWLGGRRSNGTVVRVDDEAKAWLELTDEQAERLFYPDDARLRTTKAGTVEHAQAAAAFLERCIEAWR